MRFLSQHNCAKFGYFISINDKIINNITSMGAFSAKFSTTPSGKTMDWTQSLRSKMMARTTSITMQNLVEIARRTSERDCERLKCDVFHFFIFTGRICPNGSSAGISFTHGPIFRFFAPQGRHAAPIKVKFGAEVRSSAPNFALIGPEVGVYDPKTEKKLEFYQ